MIDAAYLAKTAVRSLLYEVAVTPKPGLVDRADNGSHSDMDFFTFIDSSCALFTYFYEISNAGAGYEGEPEDMLPHLRDLGINAEKTMFAATNGVNTHKGLIFSIGILCAAAGWLHRNKRLSSAEILLETAGIIASRSVCELDTKQSGGLTNGRRLYLAHGLKGVRGEAAAGFPNIAKFGYPVMKRLLSQGFGINDAGAIALIYFIAYSEDTNFVNRTDIKTANEIRSKIAVMIESSAPDELLQSAEALNKEFISANLSPGGCADLLAITFFLLFLFPD